MKDYKKLEQRINEEKEITIGDITELGYSRYDINLFIDAGILSRSKRGLYKYLPELQVTKTPAIEEKTVLEEPPVVEEPKVEEPQQVDKDQVFQYVNQGIYNLIKRQNETAIELFNNALELEPNNGRALIGLAGANIFLNNYQAAYEYLVQFYNTRIDNSLLYNVYYYLFILKEHITIDEELLTSIKEEIDNNKDSIKKQNVNYKRLHKALDEGNYLEALKYANFSISIDKKDRKYHITNHIYKALILATLKLKGIDPFEGIAKYKEEKGLPFVRPATSVEVETPVVEVPAVEETVVEEAKEILEEDPVEEVVIIPSTPVEDTIKTNLLLEAINSNNYDLALTLLEQENIDNPLEVIRTLLTKLSLIKGLLTTNEPIKVVSVEPVRVVEEKTILEEVPVEEVPTIIPEVVETPVEEKQPVVEPTPEELIDMAYKAFKNAYHSEQFDEASKNLRRYEFLNNSNGKQRNINFHRIRIEQSKKDYEQNPERYIQKKALAKVIFDLKKERRYDAALAAIAEYKSLGGIKNELVILVEAEIYFALGDYGKTSVVLNGIRTSEEPTYFILSSKLAFKNRRYQDALQYCQAFNERRPNTSPANYQLMGDCYTKLGKSGKAIKAYRRAEEIAATQGNRGIDLTDKINKQEMIAEFKKEERDARNLGKKK